MKPLNQYVKNAGPKLDAKVRSINITRAHDTFLKARGLNLSELVRDFLDQLIKTNGDK